MATSLMTQWCWMEHFKFVALFLRASSENFIQTKNRNIAYFAILYLKLLKYSITHVLYCGQKLKI